MCEWEGEEVVGMGCSAGEWWVRMAGRDVSFLVTPHWCRHSTVNNGKVRDLG